MRRLAAILFLSALSILSAAAQSFTISGTVLEKSDGTPVEFAAVLIEGTGQWAVTDAKGAFSIKNVPAGKNTVHISCLGYVDDIKEITVSKEINNYKVLLSPDNLALESAVVTAQDNGNSATTSRTIDKTALEHVQLMNVANISSLLPGGATTNPNLTAEQQFYIRGSSGENGNPSFGTAVEIDGVRLSNNASVSDTKGAATNNIASANIESVEIISGIPSVEYGDMNGGVVKINTKKGKTPWTVTMSTNPRIKQLSLSKGFGLGQTKKGASAGVLNASLEYTNSFSNRMSPYTSYDRKQISLSYNNLFSKGAFAQTPLRLSVGFTGNLGGYNDEADPDKFSQTYEKTLDNVARGNIQLSWLLNKSWITNLELNASVSYNDKRITSNSNYSAAASTVALHGTERGYFMSEPYVEGKDQPVIQLEKGIWYNTMVCDDKPLTYKLTLKGDWAHSFGAVNNRIKLGGDLTSDMNFGVGQYSLDMATAPSYREYRYCDLPVMTNAAVYLEDNLMIPVGKDGRINLIAGLRNDNTMVPGSAYGNTSSLSPRFNAKYTIFTEKSHRNNFVKALSFRGSWGEAVKLPSFSILFPEPSYSDISVFQSSASKDNTIFIANYILPRTLEYNPALRWQRSRQAELGGDIKLGGTSISLAAFWSRTMDAYRLVQDYERFTYTYTPNTAFNDCAIPSENRSYTIDRTTGKITAYDKTGTLAPESRDFITKNSFVSKYTEGNSETPVVRYGLEWVIDFTRIKAINTSVRLDGNWYNYSSLTSDMMPYCPSNSLSSDGSPFKYVAYYYGDANNSNKICRQSLKTNLTVTTNIPKIRMIFSLKLESCLLNYSQQRSERADGTARTYALSDKTDYLSINEDVDFHNEDAYTVTFPDYYCSFDDATLRPFLQDFIEARKMRDAEIGQGIKNGPASQKYNDLCKLCTTSTTYSYMFHPDYVSPYFCLNLNVTKEIGDFASISFYANNFFNNMSQLYTSRSGQYVSSSSYIPAFYYGLTLRLKF